MQPVLVQRKKGGGRSREVGAVGSELLLLPKHHQVRLQPAFQPRGGNPHPQLARPQGPREPPYSLTPVVQGLLG